MKIQQNKIYKKTVKILKKMIKRMMKKKKTLAIAICLARLALAISGLVWSLALLATHPPTSARWPLRHTSTPEPSTYLYDSPIRFLFKTVVVRMVCR